MCDDHGGRRPLLSLVGPWPTLARPEFRGFGQSLSGQRANTSGVPNKRILIANLGNRTMGKVLAIHKSPLLAVHDLNKENGTPVVAGDSPAQTDKAAGQHAPEGPAVRPALIQPVVQLVEGVEDIAEALALLVSQEERRDRVFVGSFEIMCSGE